MSKNKKPAKGAEPEIERSQTPLVVKGSGEFTFADNSTYTGEWEEVNSVKVRHGKGSYQNGPESYTGDWVNDLMTGVGEYRFSSGASYSGSFSNGVFQGTGTYTYPDGANYTGDWHANKMHGKGEYVDAEGVKWQGDFFNGLYDSGRSYISLRPAPGI